MFILLIWIGTAINSTHEGSVYVIDNIMLVSLVLYYNHYTESNIRLMSDAMEAAEKANESKAAFMTKISHDLRTPLNGLLGFLNELMEMEMHRQHLELLNVVQFCASGLERQIVDLLDVSLIEMGKVSLANANFNLKRDLASMAILTKSMADKSNLSIHFRVDSNIPTSVRGDSVRVQQILLNLINNGLKFTQTGGCVDVEVLLAAPENGRLRIEFSVSDSGIGIPKNCMDKLFVPFMQAHQEYSSKGSGLGLYITKQLVVAMGGSINCRSEEGVGTVFNGFFLLETVQTINKRISVEPEILKGGKILVAEDNPVNMKLITRFLERFGAPYLTANNGLEAVDMYQKYKSQIALILMDIQMPVMDGIAATKEIRRAQLVSEERVPIVAVTANLIKSEVELMRLAGIDEVLPKPVKRDALKLIVEQSMMKKNKSL